jgi:tetratricopeptide (TPR) repeat protein
MAIFLIVYRCQSLNRKSFVVKKIDSQGIFVGREAMTIPGESKLDKMHQEIGNSWDNISAGKDYFANGDYEHAAISFEQAYGLKHGEKAVAGLNLARAYEKLGRNDDGIMLLDQMIRNGELSEKGIQNANEIKSRLLAAKNNIPILDPAPNTPKKEQTKETK